MYILVGTTPPRLTACRQPAALCWGERYLRPQAQALPNTQ